ncbi:MAG: UDP-N-acetylmuramoyl-tripeptide--D-alanyl-D-alanine ligase [candidate division WOR-3 bacterium]
MYYEMILEKAVRIMHGGYKNNNSELIRGVSIDSRTIKPGELFFALKGENTDGHNYTKEALNKGAVGIVVQNRTGASNEILVNDTLFALGELARYYRKNFNLPIIAITGTNGKTTVKNLIAGILSTKFKVLWTKKSYNSLIGLPLMLFEISGDEDYAVLEMGTSNSGEIKRLCEIAHPHIGIITNIGPGHLKGLGSIESIRNEKLTLIEFLPANGKGFIGPGVNGIKKNNVLRLSFDEIKEPKITEYGSSFVYKNIEFSTSLLGLNNVYNCFIAIKVTEELGIDTENQRIAIKKIAPEKGRMEPIRIDNLLIINDTYNANPVSMKSAIDFIGHLKRKKILILGDMLELGDETEKYHNEIGIYAREHSDNLLTFGTQAKIYGGMHFDDKDKLVGYLFKILKGDEVILVKASRAMKFEEIVKKILRRL